MTTMKRILLLLSILLGFPLLAAANQNAQGWCEVGATPVVTSGLTSQTLVQASYPACTVTVFIHGGGLAEIFSDNSGTPLANPFTATSNGRWLFYAANGRYDIQLSGAGFPIPVTYSDVSLADPANQQAALPNQIITTGTCAPVFNVTNNISYSLTLSCNTIATTSGTPANGNLLSLTLVQNATGGWPFAFPSNFILPLGFSFSTVALATNALTFKFDGTNWNLISNSGSGGGSNAQGPVGTGQISNGSGALAAGATLDNLLTFLINENAGFKGPNPYTDVTVASAIRNVNPAVAPQIPGITGTISSSSANLTLSIPSTFQNKDGLIIPGAGTACPLSSPVGLTVTPSIAAGPTGTGITLPAPTGSASYNYEIIAWDKAGCYTAASVPATTSTGTSTLGAQTPLTISGFTQSGYAVTVTTTSTTPLVAGAYVYISTSVTADAPYFGGWHYITSIPNGTTFTYNTGNLVANGAPATSAGGGAVYYWYVNHITWTGNAAPYQFYIYGRTGGAFNLIGQTLPNNSAAGSPVTSWDDPGATMLGTQNFTFWAPTTAPSTPLPDPLVATIISGGGTTALVLSTPALTSVTNQMVLLDQGIEFAALAANTPFGGPLLYFPGGSYVFNSHTIIPGFVSVELAGATIVLNQTLELGTGDRIFGMIGPQSIDSTSFGWPTGGKLAASHAYPGVWDNGGGGGQFYEGIQMSYAGDGGTAYLLDGGSQGHFKNINFNGAASNDYMGIPLYVRAGSGGAFWFDWDHVAVNVGPGQAGGGFIGSTSTPSVYYNAGGAFHYMSTQDRGMLFVEGGTAGSIQFYGESRSQGGITPFITLYQTGGCIGGAFTFFGSIEMDTSQQNVFANAAQCFLGTVTFFAPNVFPAGGYGLVTGNIIGFVNGTTSGQNSQSANTVSFTDNAVNVAGSGEFMYPINNTATPGLAVSSGGAVPVGTLNYEMTVVDVNGNQSTLGPPTNVTTSSGNQTVTVTPPTAPAGAVGWFPYRNGILANISGCGSTPLSFSATFVDTFSFACANSPPVINRAGAQSISAVGVSGTALLLSGGGFKNTLTGVFTTNRATSFPDNSGTVAETNFAQTWSAVQTFSTPIAVSSGGTGAATFTTNGILFGNGTGAIQASAVGGAGTVCFTETNGGTPTWSSCAGSASTAWSSLTNPSTSLALSMGTNTTTFTSGVLTGTSSPWVFTDGASTSTGSLFNLNTNASSTLHPITITGQGTANGVQMSSSGILAPLGTGGITSNLYAGPTLTVSQGGTGAATLTANCLLQGNGTSAITCLTGTLTGTSPILTITSAAVGNVPFALNTPPSPTADIFDLSINGTKTSWFDNSAFLHTPGTTYTGAGILQLSSTAGTCPTPVPGVYFICIADSVSGTIQTSLNGVTFKPVPQLANNAPTSFGIDYACSTFPQICTTSAGTAGQVLLSGGPSAAPSYGSLGVPGGGTGVATLTAHGVLMGEGTSPIGVSAAGTSGQAFLSGGASADGAFGALNLAGGSSIFTGVLPTANGGTGAASLAAASIVTATGAITAGDCVSWFSATSIQDAGVGACGSGGGSSALSAITAGTASHTINSTTFPQTWNWALTGSITAFTFGENTAATGSSNILLDVHTLTGSTAIPFQIDNAGNGWNMSSTGVWRPVGTGTLSLPSIAAYAPTTAALFGYDSTNNRIVAGNGTNTSFLPWFTSAPTSGQIATFSGTLGLLVGTSTSGTGNVCLVTSCVMTTPNLGTPSAATLTNATGLPLNGVVSPTGTIATIADGNNPLTINTAQTTASQVGITLGETTAATSTGTPYNVRITTLSGSTSTPLKVDNSLSGSQTLPTLSILPTWNTTGVVDAALLVNVTNTTSGAGSKLLDLQVGGASEGSIDKAGNAAFATSVSTGTAPACTVGTAGFSCSTEGTAPTNVSGATAIYPDSTAHELFAATNGSSSFGMLVRRQPGAIKSTGLTAAVSTATLCAASAGACNVAGEYHVHIAMYQSGAACTANTTNGVSPSLTWTDANGTTHSAIGIPLFSDGVVNALTGTMAWGATTVSGVASGDFNIDTNGSVIQYAIAFSQCTTGTATYAVDIGVTRLQ